MAHARGIEDCRKRIERTMPPAHLRFGGGSADSAITPVAAIYLMIAVVLILTLPRNKAIFPFLVSFFTIPIGEVVVFGGLHFTALRILILAGLARRATFPPSRLKGKYPCGFGPIDKVVILWSLAAIVAEILEFRQMPAVINGLGDLVDTTAGYMVVRSLIPDREAVIRTIKTMAVLCVILGLCMINEQVSKVNVFAYIGGIPSWVTIRNGSIRSGATLGCLYAGAFSGVLIPIFVWLFRQKKSRLAAVAGMAGAIAMVFTSHSTTSYLAMMGSFVGLAFWPLRKKMRMVRYGIVATLVGLQMVMKAPVWALIARIDLTGSSSGEQRYMLVDMTIRHFRDWWLIGTNAYQGWGWDSWDLCNQFVAVALTGGLLTLIFYIAIFSRGFAAVGNARRRVAGQKQQEFFFWCLGAALFATVMAHFGINYMAQLIMGFFPLVACIAVSTSEVIHGGSATSKQRCSQAAAASSPEPMPARQTIAAMTQTGQGPSHDSGTHPGSLIKA